MNLFTKVLIIGVTAYSSNLIAESNDDAVYRVCSVVGNTAEGVLSLRYGGMSSTEVFEQMESINQLFFDASGVPLRTMIKEAFNRPYHRKSRVQAMEEADFGEVYYRGCLRMHGQ